MKRCYREKNTRRMLMPTRGNPIRRMSGIFLRLLSSIVCHYVQTIEQQVAWVAAYQSSIVCNRSWEISCSWPTKIRWLKSAHQVRSCSSVNVFTKCELKEYVWSKKINIIMQIWRNWQTRTVQVRVFYNMRVRVSLSAPSKATNKKFVAFYLYINRTSSFDRTKETQ